jgi:DNA-binding SARP family transcriptional activator
LSDLAQDQWGVLRREELRRKYLWSMNTLGDLLAKDGAYERAIEIFQSLLSIDNLMEAAHRALMRCYDRKGERVLALRHYQTLVELMQDELGAPPSPETTALYHSLHQNQD